MKHMTAEEGQRRRDIDTEKELKYLTEI